MNLATKLRAGSTILVVAVGLTVFAAQHPRRFDEFGDINCEDEMARLDNLAIQLQNDPQAKAVIIFYGGKLFRGKLPRRGEAAARAARLKPYLVERRGIPADRVVVIDGGYAEEWHVDVWVLPKEIANPSPYSTIPADQIKFRNGKVNPRVYRCQI